MFYIKKHIVLITISVFIILGPVSRNIGCVFIFEGITNYYYSKGSPYPSDIKKCLYAIYKDRDYVDSLRYYIDDNEEVISRYSPQLAVTIGRTVIYSKLTSHITIHDYSMRLHIHEVWHTFQYKKGKLQFLYKLIGAIWYQGSYSNSWIERNAVASEKNIKKCKNFKEDKGFLSWSLPKKE